MEIVFFEVDFFGCYFLQLVVGGEFFFLCVGEVVGVFYYFVFLIFVVYFEGCLEYDVVNVGF